MGVYKDEMMEDKVEVTVSSGSWGVPVYKSDVPVSKSSIVNMNKVDEPDPFSGPAWEKQEGTRS
jgi:hypothetical protein